MGLFLAEPEGFDDSGHPVPVEFLTPEDRCSCKEEKIRQMKELGLDEADIHILISYSNDLRELT